MKEEIEREENKKPNKSVRAGILSNQVISGS
jgi:hypothetical protein